MNQNARGLKIYEQIKAAAGLSEQAANALMQLINPFADFEIPKTGYFDTNESSSVVQCVKFSQTYGVPAGVAANAAWDCHIATTPFINIQSKNVTNIAFSAGGFLGFQGAAGTNRMGGVTVFRGPTGQALNFTELGAGCEYTANGLCPEINQVGALTNGFLDGNARVIGMGLEVHNTTPMLTVGGAIAVYRQPQPVWLDRVAQKSLFVAGPTLAPNSCADAGTVETAGMYDLPANLAEAMLLNGSRQWEAKDGCMLVPTLNDVNIPVQKSSNVLPVVYGDDVLVDLTNISGAANPLTGYRAAVPYSVTPSVIASTNPAPATSFFADTPITHVANFNTAGAYFTGLPYSTTLTVNTIYYIERFPSPKDQNLVVLATASQPFSSAAMNLYPEFLRHLPVGVKVGDNADGDWFFEAVKSVADFLKPALAASGALHPALGVAAPAMGQAMSTWADAKLKERNKKPPQPKGAKKESNKLPPPKRPAGYPKATWNSLTNAQKVGVVINSRKKGGG